MRSELTKRISRNEFLNLIQLPGLLGEQLFNSFDLASTENIESREFVSGILTLYKANTRKVLELLFNLFDFNRNGFISAEDVSFLLNHLPSKCLRCHQTLRRFPDKENAVREFFCEYDYLGFEEFTEIVEQNLELMEVVLQGILSGIPEVVDECLELGNQPQEPIPMKYRGKQYFCILKAGCLFYSTSTDLSNPKGLILLKDLHVEPSKRSSVVLKNNRFFYEFELSDSGLRDQFISQVKQVNNYRDFYSEYTIEKSLGRGAYGTVNLAFNKTTGEKAAVKVINKEPLDHKSARRIQNEINILQLVNHPCIANLIDKFETPDSIFIILEYIEGKNLFYYLQDFDFKIQEYEAKKIMKDITKALSYLHSLGVIHRDVKLENIVIDLDEEGIKRARIIDFGLSCLLGPGQTSQDPVGTLKYAAPEVISRIPYRETVDIWSLGVVSYILLLGRMPFYGKNDQDIAMSVLKKHLDFSPEKWEGVCEQARILCSSKS